MQELLTTAEVCKILRISRSTLQRMVRRGEITPRKLAGKNLFPTSEVEKITGFPVAREGK